MGGGHLRSRSFLLNWGYFTLFEAFWGGRTPGKRVARIRVIQQSGRPIGLFESMARNFIRYVDQIPFFYAVGVIAMFSTRQHQRLGDLAAGTLVVRDREQETPLWGESGTAMFAGPVPSQTHPIPDSHTALSLPALGIAKLSSADLEVLEGFFARRLDLPLVPEQLSRKELLPRSEPNRGWSRRRMPALRHSLKPPRANYATSPGCAKGVSRNPPTLHLRRKPVCAAGKPIFRAPTKAPTWPPLFCFWQN